MNFSFLNSPMFRGMNGTPQLPGMGGAGQLPGSPALMPNPAGEAAHLLQKPLGIDPQVMTMLSPMEKMEGMLFDPLMSKLYK